MKRTYENALRLLDTRRRVARPKDSLGLDGVLSIGEMPSINGSPNFRGVPSLAGMREWLQLLGYSDGDVNNLNVIHVAGTKGKGSTCAFVRSFLRAHQSKTEFPRKIGLYTSPDLRCIRERIQINDQLISEDLFTTYFFEVWDRLSSQDSLIFDGRVKMPRFLQMLALVAFHTFIREEIEATIYETHHGGEYDATNVVQKPIVTGITSIGLDHVAQLGPSVENIAWHKAGILKSGTPAFSAPQDPRVAVVLQARAAEKDVELKFVDQDSSLPGDAQALQESVQKTNCSLALALVTTFLERKAPPESRPLTLHSIHQGIENFSWPGRFEIIDDGSSQWFLDGAHNELSIKVAAQWFARQMSVRGSLVTRPLILIFAHLSFERDGAALLECLVKSLKECGIRLQYVIFTTYQERQDGSVLTAKARRSLEAPFLDLPRIYTNIWRSADPDAVIESTPAIEEALSFARMIGEQNHGMKTLITGSLHLVGGALNLLQPIDREIKSEQRQISPLNADS